MEIPRDMKGLEKSITSSRTKVIVRGATAMSAFYQAKGQNKQNSKLLRFLTSKML